MSVFAQDFLTLDPQVPAPAIWFAERSGLAADSLRASGRLRLRVHGESMLPTLWPGDVVEIRTCALEDVSPGEIVLAVRGGRLFLHRFVARTTRTGFLLRGDSMPVTDPEFPADAFLGRLLKRKARTLPLPISTSWSRAVGRILCHCEPARRIALNLHCRRRTQSIQLGEVGSGIKAGDMEAL